MPFAFGFPCLSQTQQNPHITFQHLDNTGGLSQNSVNCIVQDQKGFLWFGTQDGLNQYDGYSFSIFKQGSIRENSISHNYILSMCIDRKGDIWIGTEQGLNKWDADSQRFTRFYHEPGNPNSLSGNHITEVIEQNSRPGRIWIGTNAGIDLLDTELKRFTHYKHDSNDENTISSNTIQSIYEAPSHPGIIWVGTNRGLNKIDLSSGKIRRLFHDTLDINDLSVQALYEAPSLPGVLWVGTRNGLFRLDMDRETINVYLNNPNVPTSLGHNLVLAIFEYSREPGTLWIGTYGGGLDLFEIQEEEFSHLTYETKNPGGISDNFILKFFEDRFGTLWIGTEGGGVNLFSKAFKSFTLFQNDPDDPNSLVSNNVRSFCESQMDLAVLWIGTYGGLSRFDQEKQKFTSFHHRNGDNSSISTDLIRCVYEDRQGDLWVGTYDGGLNLLKKGSRNFIHFFNEPGNIHSLSSNNVRVIYEDRAGTLWLGTIEGGLNRMNRQTRKFIRYQMEPGNIESLSDNRVYSISEDRKGFLWVGTRSGLNYFNPATGKSVRYLFDPQKTKSLSSNMIFSLHIDKTETLWVGTWGGGLSRFDSESGSFVHFSEEQGLANNVVYGILEDNRGNLWLSTNRGISCFDPRNKRFKNFDARDGLQGNEFNHPASYRTSKGKIYFGGLNGFNSFYPDQIKDNPLVPQVLITRFLLFNKPVAVGQKINNRIILTRSISDTSEIRLSHRENIFSLEFIALNFINPEKNEYAYKLDGLEDNWNYIGNRRFASYTTLPSGRYVFRVKASNNDGLWNTDGAAIVIRILPPFWKTWWFIGLSIFLAGISLFGFFRKRISSLEKRKKELERQVEDRTQEISLQKRLLEEANQQLERLATHDHLTGIANHRLFFEFIEREWRRVMRIQCPISLIMVDVDFFKLFNDTYGHLSGDKCLRKIAQLLAANIHRSTDLVARFGGEEFAIILSETDLPGAEALAEKIRQSVESCSFSDETTSNVRVTVSLGCATVIPNKDMSPEVLICGSDQALYRAKKEGRNRVSTVML